MLEFFFIATTLYVGPFWFAMLFSPKTDKTKKLLDKSYFFLGPILIWFVVMTIFPSNLADFSESFNSEEGFLLGLVGAMSSKAGITATWAHMVAGDIFATRWIWKKCLEHNINPIVRTLSIFFGVMLMPIGIVIYLISTFNKK
ncbi:MAG: hypothetical protein CL846_07085 [Crocinitomicaceae bacterium]|nr:hypothetical protein [Crocinitomicaceae bacterium]|tara:strand:- start:4973 stop:5401 length:429 start_codon:yes stop_codon:yes gene_type:complete